MAQPKMARITCSQCNAFYNSEHELRDHMLTAHRHASSEQIPEAPTAEHQPDEERETVGEG